MADSTVLRTRVKGLETAKTTDEASIATLKTDVAALKAAPPSPVTQAAFDALVARVAAVETELANPL